MPFGEMPCMFECEGDALLGIVSLPAQQSARGVLIVVGGPQYRAGSARQFTLLARYLAARGIPAMRFDYRGMGDSDGVARSFEQVDADLRCAADTFFKMAPGLKEIMIWGLCDAASAALFYAHQDDRVTGLVLVNPWVHTEKGEAQAYLQHYYLRRLFQGSLWRKIAAGEFRPRSALRSLADLTRSAFGRRRSGNEVRQASAPQASLPDRMESGLRSFRGRVLLVLSGNDLVAVEFKKIIEHSSRWRKSIASERISRRDLPDANHTFSRREWRELVSQWTEAWVRES